MSTPANSLNITAAGLVRFDGTATFSGVTTTNHDVLIGASSNGITNVAPSATSGVPLISQGAAADPAFGTAVVAGGGTGAVTLTGVLTGNGTSPVTANAVTQHAVLIGGASNAVSSTLVGATGTFLGGNTGADPTFQTLASAGAITSITGNSGGAEVPSAGNFNIVGTGSITVAGSANTETVQLTGLTNHAIQIGAGTATLTQLGAGTTGQVLQTNTTADPTWSTATYPSTTAQGDLLSSTSANTIVALAKDTNATRYLANTGTSNNAKWDQVNVANGVTGLLPLANGGTNANLTASNGGIFYSTASAGAILAGTATANQVLLSGASTTPAWSTATYPATTGATTMLVSTSANVITTATFIDSTTFTPVLSFGGGTTGITYGTQYGRYNRVGNWVSVNILITLTNKGSSTGSAAITVPVARANDSGATDFFVIGSMVIVGSNYYYGDLTAGTSSIGLGYGLTTSGLLAAMDNTHFANTTTIRLNATYPV